jgi:hypothetical protein
MSLTPMVLLSLLIGIVAAGLSWYIWGIAENIWHAFRSGAGDQSGPEGEQ